MPTPPGAVLAVQLPLDSPVLARHRLKRRLRRWEATFGHSSWVAKVVRRGFVLPLLSRPTPFRVRREIADPEQRSVLESAVQDMVRAGAIRRAPPHPQAVESLLFCVPKHDGGWRPCLNLKPLNRFISAPSFQLDGIPALRQVLRPGDWMVSLDLRDAYWHVPLARKHRHLTQFWFGGRCFQFDVLPFGLNVAPWVFTQVLRPAISLLRRRGVRVLAYLDDLLFLASSPQQCVEQAQMAVDLFSDLGFRFHERKSVLVPSQRLRFLGFEVDSVGLSLSMPQDKLRRLARECRSMANWMEHADSPPTIRALSRLLGRLTASSDAVLVHRLRSVALERARARALRATGSDWDSPCPLPPAALQELRWWAANLRRVQGRLVRLPAPSLLVRTDASALGWGAVVVSSSAFPHLVGQRLSGRLPIHLREAISNETELYGITQAVRTLARMVPLRGHHLRVQTDNTAALFYVNKGGGRSLALSSLARPLWLACLRAKLFLSAEHLPGKINEVADALSRRRLSEADWTLTRGAACLLWRRLGTPTVDAFADPASAQLPRFASRYPVPGAMGLSGLELDFRREFAHCFPPPRLIPLLLQRLLDQGARALVVVPWRPHAPWWPLLVRHLHRPILLTSAIQPYLLRAPHFRQPRLLAGVFSSSFWADRLSLRL